MRPFISAKRQVFILSANKLSLFFDYFYETVMKDLQILEKQQQESQAKLTAARETKQKKEAQLVDLEHSLGDLKYKDGQIRTELDRARKSLALGQREMSSVRSDTESARSALSNFYK